jgi:pyrroline-5-carboxylate reductase
MMQAVGEVIWIDEPQMDAVTALSGCGPAYMFLFADSLIEAGMQAGLSETQSRRLVMQTLKGSHSLAAETGRSFDELCAQVASPGGATEAALRILRRDGALAQLMQQAVQAALTRSREMAE